MILSRHCRATLGRLHSLGTPAATVALLRDAPDGLECLVVRKSKQVQFAGLWVFPGGKLEEADRVCHEDGSTDILASAARAAAREASEETSLEVDASSLILLSHWMPPASEVQRRGGKGFSTFFFVAPHPGGTSVEVDGGEIDSAKWLCPAEALRRHASGELGLLPPTWMTLDALRCAARGGDGGVQHTLSTLKAAPALEFATRVAPIVGGQVYMWQGDAGWAHSDPGAPGARLRLVSSAAGGSTRLVLERSVGDGVAGSRSRL